MSVPQHSSPARVTVLVGNPVPGSRTSAVAKEVGERLLGDSHEYVDVVELAEYADGLLSSGADRVLAAQQLITSADVLVVATPVYKASFTGLLKVFLDRLEPTALESTVVVPVVVSASSAHGALADLQLRVVLQAVGALLPVPSLVIEEHHLDHLSHYVDAWQQRFGRAVAAVADAARPEEVGPR